MARRPNGYIVSIDAVTEAAATDAEVARYLGVPAEHLEHVVGKDGDVRWWVDSEPDNDTPLEDQIEDILEQTRGHARDPGPATIRSTLLHVGVLYYETITCSVNVPAALLQTLEQRFPGLRLSIICYPCSDEDEEEETPAEGEPAEGEPAEGEPA